MTPQEENTLLDQIRAGQRDQYAELVRFYQAKVLGLCMSFLHNFRDAEEAAQDIFVKAYQALPSFRGEARFSTWIYRIAFRHCQDLLRQKKRQFALSLEEILESHGDQIHTLFVHSARQELHLEDKDLISRLLSAIKPDYREMLILREIQGFTYDEISEITQTSLDAVKSRLKRARKEIQEKFRHFSAPETVKKSEVPQ